MKRSAVFLLFFFMLMPVANGIAQYQAVAIDSLLIELWPDYDQKSVLVLLTGDLPAGTRFPAAVALPFPKTARIHAVARIDSQDGMMKDDITSNPDPSGTLNFITPDPKFRVEYYFPYVVKDNQRSFDFTWTAGLSVKDFQLRVQRPLAAGSFRTDPATEDVIKGQDGFDYHALPGAAVPAGQVFAVRVDYQMSAEQLSTERLPSRETGRQGPGPGQGPGLVINWPIVTVVLGSILVIVALVWQVALRRSSSSRIKPADAGTGGKNRVNFCPNCGRPAGQGDKWCGQCGIKF
ncbi:MAG: zinc ribbon domain-containing protein [Desulfobacterales bacterium]|nr:zinc ribbon domain-containing protein [Desulfobacterales bacterium]